LAAHGLPLNPHVFQTKLLELETERRLPISHGCGAFVQRKNWDRRTKETEKATGIHYVLMGLGYIE
jgi:hypothetical protein